MGEAHVVWGWKGLEAALPASDVVVIVDVLSFTTAVEVALSHGVAVYPYRWRDETTEAFAREHDAVLAGSRNTSTVSLSPPSLRTLAPGSRVVLPSPNGSTLSLATGDRPTYAGCLRNAAAVGRAAGAAGARVTVVAAGEKWPDDDSLRPAIEDLLGAGAIVDALPGARTSEARVAHAAFSSLRGDLPDVIRDSLSGQELVDLGFAGDVVEASALNVSDVVPFLDDGVYRRTQA